MNGIWDGPVLVCDLDLRTVRVSGKCFHSFE